MIIVDDSSKDENLSVIEKLIRGKNIEIIKLQHEKYRETIKKQKTEETFSNLASLLKSFEIGKEQGEDLIFFVEDDYIHCRGAKDILVEAFRDLNAPYATLYDHPDKYQDRNDSRFSHGHGKIDIDDDGNIIGLF